MINCALISDTSKVNRRIYINAEKTKQLTLMRTSMRARTHKLGLFKPGTLNPADLHSRVSGKMNECLL